MKKVNQRTQTKNTFTLKQAKELLPKRKKIDNKATAGKTLIIAGSYDFFGAGILAATAASRCGSGYVTLMTQKNKFPIVAHPDFLIVDSMAKKLPSFSTAAIGPGLGQSKQALRLLKNLIRFDPEKVVVDADALTLLAKNKLKISKNWIITPHEGELSRLIGWSATEIRQNRILAVQAAQKKLKCIVLLKGHETLIATDKKIYKIKSGNASLAKAGTGDVLTGMIAAFLTQGLSPENASCLAAFVHGWIADQWLKMKNDQISLMASDLIQLLPQALFQIRNQKNPRLKV